MVQWLQHSLNVPVRLQKTRCSMVNSKSFPTLALFHIYGKRSSICLQICGFDHHCTGQQSFIHESSERRYMYTLVYWVLLPHVWDIRQWSAQVFCVCVCVCFCAANAKRNSNRTKSASTESFYQWQTVEESIYQWQTVEEIPSEVYKQTLTNAMRVHDHS